MKASIEEDKAGNKTGIEEVTRLSYGERLRTFELEKMGKSCCSLQLPEGGEGSGSVSGNQ